MKFSGVYKIQSKIKPERIYIGSAGNINTRWKSHLSELKKDVHHSKKLQRHYNKYGIYDLQFSVLLRCDKNDLIKNEQYFLDFYNPYFNICKIAGNTLGIKFSKDACRKISLSHKGNKNCLGFKHSKETRKKVSLSLKGNKRSLGFKHSEETRKRMSESRKGRKMPPVTDEWRKKRSLIMAGRKLSEETKRRMSLAHKGNTATLGYKHTEEAKRNMSLAGIGRKKSEDTIKKMCIAQKGHLVSEETRRKISETKKWNNFKKRFINVCNVN